MSELTDERLIELTTQIITKHMENSETKSEQIPGLIKEIFNSLKYADNPPKVEVVEAESEFKPFCDPKDSVFEDYIICLEDGKKLKTLKRHLNASFGMSLEDYKRKWNLPSDYPTIAPSYSKKRSELSQSLGLGRKPWTTKKNESVEDFVKNNFPDEGSTEPKKRGRKPKELKYEHDEDTSTPDDTQITNAENETVVAEEHNEDE